MQSLPRPYWIHLCGSGWFYWITCYWTFSLWGKYFYMTVKYTLFNIQLFYLRLPFGIFNRKKEKNYEDICLGNIIPLQISQEILVKAWCNLIVHVWIDTLLLAAKCHWVRLYCMTVIFTILNVEMFPFVKIQIWFNATSGFLKIAIESEEISDHRMWWSIWYSLCAMSCQDIGNHCSPQLLELHSS